MCNLYMMLWGELPYFVACLNSYSQYDRCVRRTLPLEEGGGG